MTSHSTLQGPWPHCMLVEVSWDGHRTLPFGLSQSHGHGSWPLTYWTPYDTTTKQLGIFSTASWWSGVPCLLVNKQSRPSGPPLPSALEKLMKLYRKEKINGGGVSYDTKSVSSDWKRRSPNNVQWGSQKDRQSFSPSRHVVTTTIGCLQGGGVIKWKKKKNESRTATSDALFRSHGVSEWVINSLSSTQCSRLKSSMPFKCDLALQIIPLLK